jgi:hypothetical protein
LTHALFKQWCILITVLLHKSVRTKIPYLKSYLCSYRHSISHLSVILTSYEIHSRPRGQEFEERKHNLFKYPHLFFIFLLDVHYDFYKIKHSASNHVLSFSIDTSHQGSATVTRLGFNLTHIVNINIFLIPPMSWHLIHPLVLELSISEDCMDGTKISKIMF